MAKCKDKAQYWTFIVYPEDGFKLKGLESELIPFAVSPLHEPDKKVFDEDGKDITEAKKNHYHILVKFPYAVGNNCPQFLSDTYGTGVKAFPVSSPQAVYDYLTHKWHRDRQQFPPSVVPSLYNGFKAMKNKAPDYGNDAIETLCNIAIECKTFKEFVFRVITTNPEYMPLLTSKAYFFSNLI